MAAIFLTGATGTLGRRVLARLQAQGHDITALSRKPRPAQPGLRYVACDLLAPQGLDQALAGTEIIIHCAGSASGDDLATRNLVDAARRTGKPKIVYISVIGADIMPQRSAIDRKMFGYFAAKRIAERIIAESGLPFSTLRAAQFHQSMLEVARFMARLPIVPVPAGFRFQPVDADEVADALVDLALAPAQGLVPSLAGPEIIPMPDLLRAFFQRIGKRKLFLPLPMPGSAARAFRNGANLAPARKVGRKRWQDVLDEELAKGTVQAQAAE